MITTLMLCTLISYMHLMSTALIVILCILGVALYIVEGIVCGKISSELVHSKNPELNEVLWFWLGFLFSWIAIILTLVVKEKKNDN